jgi:hypothetical protein
MCPGQEQRLPLKFHLTCEIAEEHNNQGSVLGIGIEQLASPPPFNPSQFHRYEVEVSDTAPSLGGPVEHPF